MKKYVLNDGTFVYVRNIKAEALLLKQELEQEGYKIVSIKYRVVDWEQK